MSLQCGLVEGLIVAGLAAKHLLPHSVVNGGNVSLVGGAVAGLVGAAGALVQLQTLVNGLQAEVPVQAQQPVMKFRIRRIISLDSDHYM